MSDDWTSRCAAGLRRLHEQVCFEQGYDSEEEGTAYGEGADALEAVGPLRAEVAAQSARIAELEAALRQCKKNATGAMVPSAVIHTIADTALEKGSGSEPPLNSAKALYRDLRRSLRYLPKWKAVTAKEREHLKRVAKQRYQQECAIAGLIFSNHGDAHPGDGK